MASQWRVVLGWQCFARRIFAMVDWVEDSEKGIVSAGLYCIEAWRASEFFYRRRGPQDAVAQWRVGEEDAGYDRR